MRLLTFTLLLCVSLLASAANELIVRQTTGDTAYEIVKISQITFPSDGSGVVLTFTDGTSKTFARSQFVSLRFNGDLVGLDFVGSNDKEALLFDNAAALIMVIGEACDIQVYSVNGALVAEGYGNTLNVSELASGTYVVKAGSLTSKIVKR